MVPVSTIGRCRWAGRLRPRALNLFNHQERLVGRDAILPFSSAGENLEEQLGNGVLVAAVAVPILLLRGLLL